MVIENYELEYRKNVKTISSLLAFSNYENSTACYEINAVKNGNTSAIVFVTFESQMKEIMLAGTNSFFQKNRIVRTLIQGT